MNYEKIVTLEVLVDAMEIVENTRSMKELSPDERLELEKTSVLLRNIERSIIRIKTDQLLATTTADANALNELAAEMESKTERLAGVAKAIQKAAQVVEVFVKIAAKTFSAGLI